jgi:AhpD family alkylhydroperoxidase
MNRRTSLALSAAALMLMAPIVSMAQGPAPSPVGMPFWFSETVPDKAQAGFWEAYQGILGPNTAIPPKYQALMSLAVASQIPCVYCVYGHTKAAEKLGATKEEIRQAVAIGAMIRFNSTIIQGNQVDFAKFKAALDAPAK